MNVELTFWKKVGIVFGAIGAVLGVMISWQSIEFLPRWAWHTEVAAVQDFAVDTRMLVLGQEWERLDQQISKLEEKPILTAAERELLAKKRLRKATVESQLKELQKGQ
jgi:hypothetical protein